ncbi:MAG TPA: efflux RND transporter periplasmic adaptor subunit [Vicinamibacterales bacterium]|nr:efflux RND transporter periplasmic adaptor subunit [Vicinamibacterales bacterium]
MAVLAVAAAGACRRTPAPEPGTTTVSVVTAKARLETLRDTLTASGVVVPATAADWTVVAPESARIAELPHAEGDTVKEGDLLVRYEIPALTAEVAARQTEVTAATSQLDAAKKELDKISGLATQGLIARNDLDAKKAAVVDAQSALTTAQGALDRANAAVARARVTARFAGTIVKVMHHEGDFVSPSESDPILRLVDPTRLQVAVRLSIAEAQRISAGRAATIVIPGSPGEPATVALVPMPTDGSATSVEIRLNFVQPTTIAPETNVEAEIVQDLRENAIVIPRGAVQKDEEVTYVMFVDADNRVHRREVKLGLATRDLAQIVSGLALNDRVVTNATGQLVDGMLVQVEK